MKLKDCSTKWLAIPFISKITEGNVGVIDHTSCPCILIWINRHRWYNSRDTSFLTEIEFMAKNVRFENKHKIKFRINVKTSEIFTGPIFSSKGIYRAFFFAVFCS